ncbi:MAG: hypothetical protein GXO70_05295 [Acidobacteria bacterium]|nr:hypothetical protein [Acidobacteriota bacterium]
MNNCQFEEKIKVPAKRLFSMWEMGFEWVLAGPAILCGVIIFEPRLFHLFGSIVYLLAFATLLSGVFLLARALFWTKAYVAVDEAGIVLHSMSGESRINWAELESVDFCEIRKELQLTDRSGKRIKLVAALDNFRDLVNCILEKISMYAQEDSTLTWFQHHEPMAVRWLIVGACAVGGFTVIGVDGRLLLGLILILIFPLTLILQRLKGFRGVAIKDGVIQIHEGRSVSTVSEQDIRDVKMVLSSTEKGNFGGFKIQLVLRSGEEIGIPIKGPNLIQLYLRLRRIPHGNE